MSSLRKNIKTAKAVFLMTAFSLLFIACAPHAAGDAHKEPEKTVSEAQKTEDAAGEEDHKEHDESIAGEEIRPDREKEEISDSAVYNAGEEIPDSDRSDSDKKADHAGREDDEGEIVIPSN